MYWEEADQKWYDGEAPGRTKCVCAIFHRYVRLLGYGSFQSVAEQEGLENDPVGQAGVDEFMMRQSAGEFSGKSFEQSNEECALLEAYTIKYHPDTEAAKILVRMRALEPNLQLPDIPVPVLLAYLQILMLPRNQQLGGIPGRELGFPSAKKVVASLSG